jgi:hypothetical protein
LRSVKSYFQIRVLYDSPMIDLYDCEARGRMLEAGKKPIPDAMQEQASEEHDDLPLDVMRPVSSKSRLNSSAKHLN